MHIFPYTVPNSLWAVCIDSIYILMSRWTLDILYVFFLFDFIFCEISTFFLVLYKIRNVSFNEKKVIVHSSSKSIIGNENCFLNTGVIFCSSSKIPLCNMTVWRLSCAMASVSLALNDQLYFKCSMWYFSCLSQGFSDFQ